MRILPIAALSLLSAFSLPQSARAEATLIPVNHCKASLKAATSTNWADAPCQTVSYSKVGPLGAVSFRTYGSNDSIDVTYYFYRGKPETLIAVKIGDVRHDAKGKCEVDPGFITCLALTDQNHSAVNVAALREPQNRHLYLSY